jgi:hybrid cluster-associated redox disulfide protein
LRESKDGAAPRLYNSVRRRTMTSTAIRPDETVEQVLRRHPASALVFVRRGMSCVGCVMARFDTLAEAAQVYEQEPAELLGALQAAVAIRAT